MELGTSTKISPLIIRPAVVSFSEEEEDLDEKDKSADDDLDADDDDEENLDDGFIIEGDEVSDE